MHCLLGVWLAKNSTIFQYKVTILEVIVANSVAILGFYPQIGRSRGVREICPEEIDRGRPWGFFDGTSQGQPVKCGGGAAFHLSEGHFFHFSVGLGDGTNNYVELLSLKFLMLFALEKGCSRLQVFWDSMIILNQIIELQRCHTLQLVPILVDALDIKHRFDIITFTHVYKERNGLADRLSKEGTQLPLGSWQVEEHSQNQICKYFHRPFHDGLAHNPQI